MPATWGFRRHCAGWGLVLLATTAAHAQPGAKPTVPTAPSAPVKGADTTHLVYQRTPNGVRYAFRERGTGPLAVPGSRVAVRYTGFLPDGRIFDATQAWGSAFRFRVGRHETIAGWEELMPFVPAGSRVRVWIPAALAYGAKGVRHPDDDSRFMIAPNTDLTFELQVLSVR
ncbi:FKBP-type peptidyl-prolyl cis-trans isomerase [Hymenobacter properus]|uniref:Peptidyl-prolyl cis-trans isomerase n=1 Tax=Hymenobacter properus TaxID=2791026 RepID=A0A931FN85_9BACT|nr:FKBP-type peptidyl-prolyl cis-trans isomerase [Hymenobacter properus]MBF9143866.1 FKBP-type peptidyl-prolyl cis-trans isomerase [Hymenobacter properus]MBR7722680.1 FKBP-type peptidyl-prolyl cis-trans isomerase [Microvirga sp. SRT04]